MFVCVGVCASACRFSGDQTSDPPELELQGFVSCVTWVLGALLRSWATATSPVNCWAICPALEPKTLYVTQTVALKGPGSGWTVHVLWLRNENYVLSYGRYYCQWSKDKMGVPRGIKAEGRGLIIAGGSSRKLSIARESASVLLWQSSQERHAEPPGRELAISLHSQGDFLLLWNQVPQWLTLWAATPSVQGQKALAAVITAWAVFAHLRGPPELSFSLGANPSPASLFPVPHH